MTRGQKTELKKYIDSMKDECRQGPGKPSTLTWDKLAQIKALLYEGNYQKYVYGSMGIPKPTWESWKQKGVALAKSIVDKELAYTKTTDVQQKYIYFAYIVEVGKSKAVTKNVRIINDASKKDWRAARWYLEVIDRDHYGEKIEATVQGEVTMKRIVEKYKERIAQAENE